MPADEDGPAEEDIVPGTAPSEGPRPSRGSSRSSSGSVDQERRVAVPTGEDLDLVPATQRATAEATSGRTKLRFTYGRWLLFLATAQIVIADAGFFWYAIANSWQISDRAIIG